MVKETNRDMLVVIREFILAGCWHVGKKYNNQAIRFYQARRRLAARLGYPEGFPDDY